MQAQSFLKSQATALACPGLNAQRAGITSALQTYSGPAGTFTGYVGKEKYYRLVVASPRSITFQVTYYYDARFLAGHLFVLTDTTSTGTVVAAMTNPVPNGAGGTLTYNFATAGTYYLVYDSKSTAGTPPGVSLDFNLAFTTPCVCYAVPPSAPCASGARITQVKFKNAVIKSGCNTNASGYSMGGSGQWTSFGDYIRLDVQMGLAQRLKVWGDINKDGDFDDAGEVLLVSSSAATSFNDSLLFDVKSIANLGSWTDTKIPLRIRSFYNVDPTNIGPCELAGEGETFDTDVTIQSPEIRAAEAVIGMDNNDFNAYLCPGWHKLVIQNYHANIGPGPHTYNVYLSTNGGINHLPTPIGSVVNNYTGPFRDTVDVFVASTVNASVVYFYVEPADYKVRGVYERGYNWSKVINNPTLVSDTVCAGGSASLRFASPLNPSYSYAWYDAPTGGSPIAQGPDAHTLLLPGSVTTKYGMVIGAGNCYTSTRLPASVVVTNNTPDAISVAPGSGTSGTLAKIQGVNMYGTPAITFDDEPASQVVRNGATTVWARVPRITSPTSQIKIYFAGCGKRDSLPFATVVPNTTFGQSQAVALACPGVSNQASFLNNNLVDYSGPGGTYSGYLGKEKYYKLTFAAPTSVTFRASYQNPNWPWFEAGKSGGAFFILGDTTGSSVLHAMTQPDTTGQRAQFYYEFQAGTYYIVYDGKGAENSTPMTFSLAMECYCMPVSASPCASDARIQLATIGQYNSSAKAACSTAPNGLTKLDATVAGVLWGKKTPLKATFGSKPMNLKVWIDLNGDGDFTDAGEMVYMSQTASTNLTDSIYLPLNHPNFTAESERPILVRALYNVDPATVGACDPVAEGETYIGRTYLSRPSSVVKFLLTEGPNRTFCPGPNKLVVTSNLVGDIPGADSLVAYVRGLTAFGVINMVIGKKPNRHTSPFQDTIDVVIPQINAPSFSFSVQSSAGSYFQNFSTQAYFLPAGPAAPSITGTVTACPGTPATLTATSAAGTRIRWYSSEFGGNLLDTGKTITFTPTATTSHWAEAYFTTGCARPSTRTGYNVFVPELADVTTVSPAAGRPGVVVQIFGTNFSGTPQVWFGSTLAANVTRVSDTRIDATVPAGLPPQTLSLRVQFEACNAKDSVSFQVLASPPTVASTHIEGYAPGARPTLCPGGWKLVFTVNNNPSTAHTWKAVLYNGNTEVLLGTKAGKLGVGTVSDTIDMYLPTWLVTGSFSSPFTIFLANNQFGTAYGTANITLNGPSVDNPAVKGQGDTVCYGLPATVVSTGTQRCWWFDTPSGGYPLSSIQTYITPPVTAARTLYVEGSYGPHCTWNYRVPIHVGLTTSPVLTAVTPATAGVGQDIQIQGSNFARRNVQVTIGGVSALAFRASPSAINAVVPSLPEGPAQVKVFFPHCQTRDSLPFTVGPVTSNWPITFGGTESEDAVRGIVRDASGNIYVSICFKGTITLGGTAITSGVKRDGLLAKLNDAGQLLWYTRIGNSTFGMEPRGVNIDGAGNPYWAGSFAGTITFAGSPAKSLTGVGAYDAFAARFDPATGNCVWATKVGSTAGDYLYACFVSNSGNVYAGGSFGATMTVPTTTGNKTLVNAGGLDGFIVKMNPDGQILWTSQCSSTANDEVKSIEYMGGDLIACGYMGNACTFPGVSAPITMGTFSGSRDGWVSRINSEGKYVWVKAFGSQFNDEAFSTCMDNGGNVYAVANVSGWWGVNGQGTYFCDQNGIALVSFNFYTQAFRYGQSVMSGGNDAPSTVRWDGQKIVVAGFVGGGIGLYPYNPMPTPAAKGGSDAFLTYHQPSDGKVVGVRTYGGSGNDQGLALWCNTATREAFLGGFFTGTGTLPTPGGSEVVRTSNGGTDGFLCRVAPPGGAREGIQEFTTDASGTLSLWPNPAGRQLIVQVADETATPACFDMQGRLMALPVVHEGNQFRFDVSGLRSGVYLMRFGGRTARFTKQ